MNFESNDSCCIQNQQPFGLVNFRFQFEDTFLLVRSLGTLDEDPSCSSCFNTVQPIKHELTFHQQPRPATLQCPILSTSFSDMNTTDELYNFVGLSMVKGARSHYFRLFCLISLFMSSKRQIGEAGVSHLQNYGHIITEIDFPAV